MKISYNWLKEYIKTDRTPEQLSELLTGCGLEVESLEKIETVKGGLKGVVIGEVLTCQRHPDADRLSVTTVNIGNEVVPIVCGAPNVAQGQKVAVATEGTTLYTSAGEPFPIKKAKIRGQESRGMICAEDELGLGASHDGIMVLRQDAIPGTPAANYFQIEDDYLFEIGLTPNRIDAASHMGVARDVAAVLKHHYPNQPVQLVKPDISKFSPDETTSGITIQIVDTSACPRYSGLVIDGVTVGESPDWLKNRLRIIGLKPINNVVDITNFVLHETGQPLHAFDAAKIEGEKVIIRKPESGTPFETLDEQKINLSGNDLMICNAYNPMCMAGIMGGLESGVTESTKTIFLESAYFEPAGIRKSSKTHSINSDSSFRFERGADPEMTLFAMKRAGLLIKELAGGRITSHVMDAYPRVIEKCIIQLTYADIFKLTGKKIAPEVVESILLSLDFEITSADTTQLTVKAPLYRVDVTRPADVIEEILRIYGYNNVELPGKLHASIVSSPKPDKEKLQNVASDYLSSRGFNEIMNNSLTKAFYYSDENLFDPDSVVKVLNPLSQDLGVMRQSLFFGGMETLEWNQNRKVSDLKVYEFGNVYFKEKDKTNSGLLKLAGYRERRMLAMFATGYTQQESWYGDQKSFSLFDLKAEMASLISRMNVDIKAASVAEFSNEGFFSAGLRYYFNNEILAEVGEVANQFTQKFDIRNEVFFASINWELVLKLHNKAPVMFRAIPRFPEVRRDLALLVSKDVKFTDLEKSAFNAERKLLKQVSLFDVYTDEKMGSGMKSYAMSFVLIDENKTLTDKEIEKSMQRIAQTLSQDFGATIR